MPCVSMARRELECPLRRHVALAPLLGSERDDAVEVAHRRRVRRRGVVLVARRTPHGSRARPAEAVNSWQPEALLEARKRARLLGRVDGTARDQVSDQVIRENPASLGTET